MESLGYYKKKLLKRQQEIEEILDASADDRKPVELDQTLFGRLSRMDAMQQQEMSQATTRMLKFEQQRIQAALKRVEEDDFGYCLVCDEEIPDKRLDFDPSVPLCVPCAEDSEKRRR
jgi:DnaK suppressor protein